jgi:hypothetical protein
VILVGQEELSGWPADAVQTMKFSGLLEKSRPAKSVVCPGCEQQCVMPVHTLIAEKRSPQSFVVCGNRSDINRVPVAATQLEQWHCDMGAVCGFVAESLGLRRTDKRSVERGLWEIGIAHGKKRVQMLSLKADGALFLLAGNNQMPLAELIRYRAGSYTVDGPMVERMVDSAMTADARYTPSTAKREARKLDTQAMYASWQKEYRKLKKERPEMSDVWYAQRIAQMEIAKDSSPETIRKHMKG